MSGSPTARWAIPKSATPTRRRAGSDAGPAAHRCSDRRRTRLATMPALRDFIDKMKAERRRGHLLGLLSPGGVHSHQRHIAALAQILAKAGLQVAVHAFLDGRDTPPKSAARYLQAFQEEIAGLRGVRYRIGHAAAITRWIATSAGTGWKKPILAIVDGIGERADHASQAVEAAYARGETDEFVMPTAIGRVRGDTRRRRSADRQFPRRPDTRDRFCFVRSLTSRGLQRKRRIEFAAALGLVEYSTELNRFLATLFPPEDLGRHLGRGRRARRVDANCASPRPRNTRMSLSSSMAGARPSFLARSASWSLRRKSRPTTCSPKCRRRRSPIRSWRRSGPAASMSSC